MELLIKKEPPPVLAIPGTAIGATNFASLLPLHLSDDEIPLFLSAIDNSPVRNAYALCLFSGLREGECLGLSWGQVDLEKGRITVSQQLQKEKAKGGRYYIDPSTKSGKPRTIKPPPASR